MFYPYKHQRPNSRARLIPITLLPSFPWARNVHSLCKRSSLPISVLFFLCALPSVTSHPVKNDLQVFHLLKPLSLTSSPYKEKMDWIMYPNPSAKPITKGAQLTLPCQPPANCKVLWLVRQKLCNSGGIPQATLCARPSHTSKSCPNHSTWELARDIPYSSRPPYFGAVSTEINICWVHLGGLVHEHKGLESDVKQLKQLKHVY